jgi:hypothetical protein
MNDTIERSQADATFVPKRTYPVPVQAVWHALRRRTRSMVQRRPGMRWRPRQRQRGRPVTWRAAVPPAGHSRRRAEHQFRDHRRDVQVGRALP